MKKSFDITEMFGPKVTDDRSLCKRHRRKMAEKINDNITLYNDDCVQILKGLDDDSISCCVTDPPYHLTSSKKSDRGFMGYKWDGGDIAFSLRLWKEVFRVLKPGGYILAFGSPRTSHRMVTAIEMAGFDIKDSLEWLYGEGMVIRLDVSKAIDKKYGAVRQVVGTKKAGMGGGDSHPYNRKGDNSKAKKEVDITIPASSMAKYWDGWDCSLKPSHEPIAVARKPLQKGLTVADNVIEWGAGAMNVGACKISNDSIERLPSNTIISEDVAMELGKHAKYFYCPKPSKEKHLGCEHLKLAPKDLETKGRRYDDKCENCGKKFISNKGNTCSCPPGKKKTADRKPEKYHGKNFHNTVKPIALMEYLVKLVTPTSGICIDPFMGSGSTGIACSNLGFNFIGIEQDENYYQISKARINYSINNKKAA